MKLTIEVDDRTLCVSVTSIYSKEDGQMKVGIELYDTKRIAEMIVKEKDGE